MNWDAIGAIGENVGALAVVVSVLYLAYQVKQTTRHSQAQTEREIINNLHRHQAQIRENPGLIRRAFSSFNELTGDEKFVASTYFNEVVSLFESTRRLDGAGLVQPDIFESHRKFVLAFVRSPGGAQWWADAKYLFAADMHKYLDEELARGIDLPPPVTETIPYYGIYDEN
jgi:hypothetical protein